MKPRPLSELTKEHLVIIAKQVAEEFNLIEAQFVDLVQNNADNPDILAITLISFIESKHSNADVITKCYVLTKR